MRNQQESLFKASGTKNFFYYSVIMKNLTSESDPLPSLDNLKKEYISYLLKITNNDKSKTAQILNISMTGLTKELEKHESIF